MSDKKQVTDTERSEVIVAQAKDFWTRNSKIILGVGTVLLLLVGGYFIYKNFFQKPKEQKAAEAMVMAQSFFNQDSFRLAIDGNAQYPGMLKIMQRYRGTDAANLAHYYAGVSYMHLDDNTNAVKYLKDFSTSAKQIQQRAYKVLGDAYGDLGNKKEALEYYKKAARHFEEDEINSAEALFFAANAASVLNDNKEAIELFKELKEKYPRAPESREADKFLAKLGVYNVN